MLSKELKKYISVFQISDNRKQFKNFLRESEE